MQPRRGLGEFRTHSMTDSKPEQDHTAQTLFDTWLESGAKDRALDEMIADHPDVGERLLNLVQTYQSKAGTVFHSVRTRGREDASQGQSSEQVLRAGVTLGNYKLIEQVGRGGMGVVWEAEDLRLRRRIALKLMLPSAVDSRSIELFSREARAGGRLSHPSLITIFE